MAKLIVLPTLERLHAYDRGDRAAIGMVFSVALDEGGPPPKHLTPWRRSWLRPWSWPAAGGRAGFLAIQEIQIYYRASTADRWLEGGFFAVNPPPREALKAGGLAALRQSLEDRFACFLAQTGQSGKPGNPWEWLHPQEQPRPVDPDCRPWSPFLAHVSQLPWPLPQALGMSFFERLSCEMKEARLVGAPVLRLSLGAGSAERRLVPGPPVRAGAGEWELQYEHVAIEGPALTIRAVTAELPPRPKAACFFDLASLWIADPDAGAPEPPAGDWRSGLENRLASQLDPVRALLDWLRAPRPGPHGGDLREAAYPEAAAHVLRALQRSTLPTLGREFIGGRLLRRLAAAWSTPEQPIPAAVADALDAAAAPWFEKMRGAQGVKLWRGWVATAMHAAVVPDILEAHDPQELLEPAAARGPAAPRPLGQRLTLAEALNQLDALVSQLTSPAVSREVFRQAWSHWQTKHGAQLAGKHELTVLAGAFAGTPPRADIDLAYELLRASAGRAGQKVLRDAFNPDLSAQLADQRLRLQVSLGQADTGIEGWDWLLGKDALWCRQRAQQIALAVLPAASGTAPAPQATGGLTVQVDGLALSRQDDRLQDIQGVALLLRDAVAPRWSCLNMAEAWVGEQCLHDAVLLPSRLAYVGELSAPTLTYDQQPLAVAGPLAGAAAVGVAVAPVAVISPLDEPLVDFRYCRAVPAGQLPELVFGHDYLAQPFLVSNSGAIPRALTGSDATPWSLRAPIDLSLDGGSGVRRLRYRREAAVGALRIGQGALPTVPPSVAPRLRELPPAALLPENDPLLGSRQGPRPPDTAGDSILAGTPLLLLAARSLPLRHGVTVPSEFSFRLASPTTDLRTWDRWIAGSPSGDRRKFVWRSFHELANAAAAQTHRSLEKAGLFLDDPAVIGLWAELASFSPCGELLEKEPPSTGPILFAQATGATNDASHWSTDPGTLGGEQRPAISVHGRVAENGALTLRFEGQEARELSAAGRLYRLTVYAVLAPDHERRFSRDEAVRHRGGLALTSPWHLLIEVARGLPAAREDRERVEAALWRTLVPSPARAAAGSLDVGLDLADPELSGIADLIDRADLLHQVWGWRGRPPAVHPDLAPAALLPPASPNAPGAELERYLDFEMAEFGARTDEERRRLPMLRVDAAAEGEAPAFVYRERLDALPPVGDARALHHRFGARVWSRYRGILPDAAGSLDTRDAVTGTLWRRLFVPCRFRGAVPPPKIKFVLPLTQERPGACGGGPGLLVAVDGPWYEVGGLAEELAVEVMTVVPPDPHDAGRYYQAGTDPIVTGAGAGEQPSLSRGAPGAAAEPPGKWPGALAADAFTIDLSAMTGAIGHSRDHAAAAPNFLASSFLLEPPVLGRRPPTAPTPTSPMPPTSSMTATSFTSPTAPTAPTTPTTPTTPTGDSPAGFAWWFFKLRFARKLRAVEMTADGKPRPVELQSEWSAPFWVQLLPALDRVEADWFGGAVPKVDLAAGCRSLVCDPPPVRRPAPFYLFAVMTRGLRDFAGRTDQEAYVGVWWPAAAASWTIDEETAEEIRRGSAAQPLHLRWIEVQSPREPRITRGDDLWQALFDSNSYGPMGPDAGDPHPDASRCRIVRISPRFTLSSERAR